MLAGCNQQTLTEFMSTNISIPFKYEGAIEVSHAFSSMGLMDCKYSSIFCCILYVRAPCAGESDKFEDFEYI